MNYYLRLLTLVILLTGSGAQARVISSITDGNWGDPATWDQTTIPNSGDTIVISAGDTVFVYQNVIGLSGIWIQVYGHLQFRNSRKIELMLSNASTPASMITFYTGFYVFGGNGSSGISFGSGGSGCDIYRPAAGSIPGVFPSLGSYYDGCTWASYLSAEELWAHAELLDRSLALEWRLNEPVDAYSYAIIGGNEVGEREIAAVRAKGEGTKSYYKEVVPVEDFTYFRIEMESVDHKRKNIYSISLENVSIAPDVLEIYPNPFAQTLYVSDRLAFDLQLLSMDGRNVLQMEGQNHYSLETDDLEDGVYFLQTFRDGRLLATEKVVKH